MDLWERRSSSALAMELSLSCTNSSMWCLLMNHIDGLVQYCSISSAVSNADTAVLH